MDGSILDVLRRNLWDNGFLQPVGEETSVRTLVYQVLVRPDASGFFFVTAHPSVFTYRTCQLLCISQKRLFVIEEFYQCFFDFGLFPVRMFKVLFPILFL